MHGIIMMKDLIKLKIITSDLNGMISTETRNIKGRIWYYINERKQINLVE